MKVVTTILLISLITGFNSLAQQQQLALSGSPVPCVDNYQQANDAFEIGDFDRVISLLTGCSTDNLSDEDKINLHMLLCRTYYSYRDNQNAEAQAKQIFRIDPEFEVSQFEKIGVQNLIQSVKPRVGSSLSLLFGLNLSLPTTTTVNNYEGDTQFEASTTHSPLPAMDVNLQWKLYTDLGINPIIGISYTQLNFKRQSDSGGSIFRALRSESEETDQFLKFELGASYLLKKRIIGLDPFFEIGAAYNKILSSTVAVQSEFVLVGPEPNDSPPLDFTDNRQNSFGIFLTAGGLKKVQRGNLMVKVQFYKGLTSQVNRDRVLQHKELLFSSNYFDNDFIFNYITIAFGYEKFYFKYK